jgi:hypothetical protein
MERVFIEIGQALKTMFCMSYRFALFLALVIFFQLMYIDTVSMTKGNLTSRLTHLEELVLCYRNRLAVKSVHVEGLQFSDLLSNLKENRNIRKITFVLRINRLTKGLRSVQNIVDADLGRCADRIDEHLSNRHMFPLLDNFTVLLEYISREGWEENPSLKGTIRSCFPRLAQSGRLYILR